MLQSLVSAYYPKWRPRSKPGGRSIIASATVSGQQGTGAGQRRCPFRVARESVLSTGQTLRHHHKPPPMLYPHRSPLLTRLVVQQGGSSKLLGKSMQGEKSCVTQLKPAVGTAYNSQSESQRHDRTKNKNDSIRGFPFSGSPTDLCQARPLYARTENVLSETKRHPYCTPAYHRSQGPSCINQ